MNYKLLFTATICAAAFCATPVHADYTSWQDPSYDFSKISRIYVARVDMSDVALSSARQKSLETTFASRMNKAKIPKDVMLTIEAPTASKSLSVSRVQKRWRISSKRRRPRMHRYTSCLGSPAGR